MDDEKDFIKYLREQDPLLKDNCSKPLIRLFAGEYAAFLAGRSLTNKADAEDVLGSYKRGIAVGKAEQLDEVEKILKETVEEAKILQLTESRLFYVFETFTRKLKALREVKP